jgi:hypothetical protein
LELLSITQVARGLIFGPHTKGPDNIRRTKQDLALNVILKANQTLHLQHKRESIPILRLQDLEKSQQYNIQAAILRIYWPDQVTNKELWKRTKQYQIDMLIRKCKWGWLGHKLRKKSDDIARQALEWNAQGKRGRVRPRNTWRRTVFEEAKGVTKTCEEI